MNILNYGVYFTLDNGFESYTEIDSTTKEGLEHGFVDIYEAININWLIEENGFDNDVCVDSWEIKRLSSEDIVSLDFLNKEGVEIVMLTENELNTLYDGMVELLEERGETDKITEINLDQFKEWVKKLEEQYKEDDEDISFYEYVNDWIYEKICCE